MLPSRRAIERANRRRSRLLSQPDFSPLTVIALLLLTVFLLQPCPEARGVGVDLAKVRFAHNEPGAGGDDAAIISVSRDGRFYYLQTLTTLPQLRERLEGARRGGADRKVYLQPDARARQADVSLLIDELQRDGVTNVAIMAEKLRAPRQQR